MDNNTYPSHGGASVSHRASPTGSAVKKKRQVRILIALLVALLIAAATGAGFMVWQNFSLGDPRQVAGPVVPEHQDDEADFAVSDIKPDNPVDFAALKVKNPDIYAWVSIPGTRVDVPILQSAVDDNFYLDHNADGEYSIAGAAYTQRANATDFSDPVTMVYGHQVADDSMFTTLHYFEDKTFFEEHNAMYIYTAQCILTYEIVAAYQYDDRHILNSFDFSDPAVVQEYFDAVINPASMLVNVREGATLSADDRIVQLSTCMDVVNRDHTRYLVTGVLIDEQETN